MFVLLPNRSTSVFDRVKSGIFGQTAKFGQRPCLFRISNIGIKNISTKQTVKILMRRLIRSRLIWVYTVCKCVSEFTWCPNLHDFTLDHFDEGSKYSEHGEFMSLTKSSSATCPYPCRTGNALNVHMHVPKATWASVLNVRVLSQKPLGHLSRNVRVLSQKPLETYVP